jgi:hypothetical protein
MPPSVLTAMHLGVVRAPSVGIDRAEPFLDVAVRLPARRSRSGGFHGIQYGPGRELRESSRTGEASLREEPASSTFAHVQPRDGLGAVRDGVTALVCCLFRRLCREWYR